MRQLTIPHALEADLTGVEATILGRIEAHRPVAAIVQSRLDSSAAPRLHAALVLLCAQLGSYQYERTRHTAATAELIALAVRVHDGLIDEDQRRAGSVGANSENEANVVLMVGNYLLTLAATEMALLPDPRIIGEFSRAVMAISEAQLAPVTDVTPLETALAQYSLRAESKTATLVAAACRAGMVCGGGDDAQIDAIGRFGMALGLAARIADEIAREQLRPDPMLTIASDRVTLPLIFAAVHGAPLAALAEGPERRAALIREYDGLTAAASSAERSLAEAIEQLAIFPTGPARVALSALARDLCRFEMPR